MNLSKFMNKGISNITKTATRFYLNNKRGRAFILKLGADFRRAAKKREFYEKKQGTHIPPFLIASIVSACNLRCAGCYARANESCEESRDDAMRVSDWEKVFRQASGIGVSFIILAGGEPLLRRDVLEAAASFGNILFPVFTNGTMLDERYLDFFNAHRNMIPVLSIEGDDAQTDTRRGEGVSASVWQAAGNLHSRGILFGVSITVTRQNIDVVTGRDYAERLFDQGCGVVFYIEYVPAESDTEHLTLSETDAHTLRKRTDALKEHYGDEGMLLVSFPGDEERMGGCLAAGRGFFHINPDGGAEPCPFSPFSELNVKDQSLLDVLKSPFFERVQKISAMDLLHHNQGGCTLFAHQDEVSSALGDNILQEI